MDVYGLAQQCAPDVAPTTIAAIVTVESSHNPYAIGVVGGALARQPRNLREALATVRSLLQQRRNFSMGLAQVNRFNLPKHNVSYEQVFDPCTNLRVGSAILKDCYVRAGEGERDPQRALRAAFSCYYSGNFKRGFRPDKPGELSYVDKVVNAAGAPAPLLPVVPAIEWTNGAHPMPPAPKAPQASVLVAQFRDEAADAQADALAQASVQASLPTEPELSAPQAVNAGVGESSAVVF